MATEFGRRSEPQPAVGQFKTGCGRSDFAGECQQSP